jgi:general secretion pathway protein K
MAGPALNRTRGAAIILAMLIAALAAAVAATVFADQQRWLRTVEHRRDQVQAQALAMAGVQWTRQIIDEDARRSQIDHLGEPWALELPPIPMEDGEIRGAIVDAQGRSASTRWAPAMRRRTRNAPGTAVRAAGMPPAAPRHRRLIDADGTPGEAGAEDAFYLGQPVPRLAANAPVVASRSWGRRVGPQAGSRHPFLPLPRAPLNVNTAPREVLAAVLGSTDGESSMRCLPTAPANLRPSRVPPRPRMAPRPRATPRCHQEQLLTSPSTRQAPHGRTCPSAPRRRKPAIVWQVE